MAVPSASSTKHRKLCSIGNYQLLSLRIGEGSFSKVELANHGILNKKVALKIIQTKEIKDPYVKKNLRREAIIMSKMSHPNVVGIHEVCAHEEFFCLAMDFCSGGNLCDLVLDSARLDEDRARVYFRQMMQGLQYIHSKGIIHRDIKLENVFLTRDRSIAVIGDFGLSNFWSPGSVLKTRCGSAEYAAPELLDRTKTYDQGIDVWSSGVCLYAMFVGQLPFNAEENANKVTELFKQIKVGLTDSHFKSMDHISVEAKVMMNHVLTVDADKRIKIPEILEHHWFTDLDIPEESLPQLSLDSQLDVAKSVQTKLKLDNWTPQQILAYVKSSKGRFGKTAGVFNLIARDFQFSQMSQKTARPVIKPALVPVDTTTKDTDSPAPPLSSSREADIGASKQQEVTSKQQDSFWQTGQGKAAIFALSQLKSEQQQQPPSKETTKMKVQEPETIVKKPRQQPVKVKPFFKPEKLGHAWRRSIKPVPGQGGSNPRQGRLKRVDTTVADRPRRPLADLDKNSNK